MTDQPISPIIARHLDALLRSTTHRIPQSFSGATGELQSGKFSGEAGPIASEELRPAMNTLNPPDVFIAYCEAYIAQPDLFQRSSIKAAIHNFLKVYEGTIHAIEQGELGRFMEPAWQPATRLQGNDLNNKSTNLQKIHALDILIDNPHVLIAYAVVDAVFRDFYNEQKRFFSQPIPPGVDADHWSVISGAVNVLNTIFNHTNKPDVGIAHGPIVQAYFHHVQRVVNHGGTFGDITPDDIREHLKQLNPSRMFDGTQTTCPAKSIFIAAALGITRRAPSADDVSPARDQRLWVIYQRARIEAGELAKGISDKLRSPFYSAVYNMRGEFKRPVPRAPSSTPPADLSGGQS